MPVQKLKEYLDKNKVRYVVICHSTAYTATEIAASAHVRGRNLAKTVMVKLDGMMAMAVLPANFRVDLEKLRIASSSGTAELAAEHEFAKMIPGCEEGAMPPFGNLYGLPVWVEKTLAEDEEIAFNACSHAELLQLAYKDFAHLAKPTVASFKE